MQRKKMLTLEDLVKFCKEQKLCSFSAKESGYQLCVRVPASFEQKEAENSSLFFGTVKAFHTGKNRNESSVTDDAMEKSKSTFAYKPILAAFTTDANGDEDFMSHEMEMDDDGNIIYIEHQVGCFTTDEPWIEADPDDANKNWIWANCAIPREYTHAADIIERKKGTKVSVELIINKFSYDENEDVLVLEDIEVSGLTLLGVYEEGADPDDGGAVEEGMEGARLDIADFSKQKNSVLSYEELTDVIKETVMQALNDMNNSKEGGQKMKFNEEKLNELLEKYAVKSEDLTFDLEAIESDEALEEAFEAQFSNPSPEDSVQENYKFTVEFDGETRNFAKSLNEQIKDITILVNATYGEADNAWYDCECYDDKTVVFHDWFNNRHFKQKYGNKDGMLALKGERTEVFARFLTEEEIAALDDLKSKFEATVKDFEAAQVELGHYHDEPAKEAILNDEAYSSVSKTKEFAELLKSHFEMSIDDVQSKADEILLAAAKAGKVEFAKKSEPEEEATASTKPLPFNSIKKRYGNLLDI